MYINNLDPVIISFGLFSLRWYSLAYIAGIILGWIYGKNIISKSKIANSSSIKLEDFDNLITYIIISIILGGRLGYVIFYNLNYFIENPLEIFMIWKGGMSFHGGLIGVVLGTAIYCKKVNQEPIVFFDIVACVAPIGLFFGRIANFINGELYGVPTETEWGVIFPNVDDTLRHPSQLYEAFSEGIILFIILNIVIYKTSYRKGMCSSLFLIFYGVFRILSEIFREPDQHLGYIFDLISTGSLLSLIMIIVGSLIYFKLR